jgi:succinate dehydrogenase/fumarate reductase flavoprotein subunit
VHTAIVNSMTADVVVVGGGGSGLAGAIAAAKAGAQVVLLEKNKFLGGTTRLSIGSISATRTALQKKAGIQDDSQGHFEDIIKFADPAIAPRDNIELRRVLVDDVTDTVAWLTSLGVSFFGPMPEPPHRKARMHNVLPNSISYIYHLQREALRRGVAIKTAARVEELLSDNGVVTGVRAIIDGDTVTVAARRGVILATGDFSNSQQLKMRFRPDLADVDAINPSSTGDGQLMGERVGGEIVNGDLMYGQLRFVAPTGTNFMLRLPPNRALAATMRLAISYAPSWILRPFLLAFVTTFLAPEMAIFKQGAILVNSRGERFCDETEKPHLQVAKQPDKIAYILFDEQLAKKLSGWPHYISTAPGTAYAYLPDYRRNRKDLYHEATDLSSLATQLGMPSASLRSTIDEYNDGRGAHARGNRPAMSSGRYVVLGPVRGWTVLGDGGLKVNDSHQVLRKDGSVIVGLYAAGSVGQGGLLLEGHGHHLGWAFTSGRRAGRNAATNQTVQEATSQLRANG